MGGLPALWALYDIKDKNGYTLPDDFADEDGNKMSSNASRKDYYYMDGENKITGEAKNWLSPSDIASYTIENVMAGDGTGDINTGAWNPLPAVEKTSVPDITVNGNIATWTADKFAICYVVIINGKPAAFVTDAQFIGNEGDRITVQSVNEHGILSAKSTTVTLDAATNINNIDASGSANSTTDSKIYNVAGQRTTGTTRGILIRNGRKFVNR